MARSPYQLFVSAVLDGDIVRAHRLTKLRGVPEMVPRCLLDVIDGSEMDWGTLDFLVKLGADPHVKFENGANLVNHLCKMDGMLDLIEYLVEEKNVDVNNKDEDGNTPLHGAVFFTCDKLELIKLLLDHGADPLAENNAEYTPRKGLEDFLADMKTGDPEDFQAIKMLKQKENEILSLLLLKGNMLERSRERMYDPRVWRTVIKYAGSRRYNLEEKED